MTMNELRSRVEDPMRTTRRDVASLARQDVQRLVHELQVHQIELEMQNDALQHAQEDLEVSQKQYQELFDCAPAGYLMLDANGAVVRANLAASILLGLSREQLLGQPLIAFVVDTDVMPLSQHLRAVPGTMRDCCEVQLRPVADVVRHVRLDTTTVPSLGAGCLVVLTDVTERQRSYEALRQVTSELESRVAARTLELAARNRELEAELKTSARLEAQRRDLERRVRDADRLESLSLLAGGLAHDFNNLLVSVLGNAELFLLEDEVPEDWRALATQIMRAGRTASDLTRQLLVFAGRGRVSKCELSLPYVVAESLELVRTRLPPGVQLQAKITSEVSVLEADRGQLQQAVINLVTNAIEAVGETGVILVETGSECLDAKQLAQFQHGLGGQPGRFSMLRVYDSGSGIDPASLPRIFDPFFTTKFTGRGLGLATVLGIVQAHGGLIKVRSEPGEGTCLELAFPLPEVRVQSERPAPPLEAEWTGSGRVLLIDDDDAVRSVVARMLTLLGFDVTTASGGERGLELFQYAERSFQLVVLDWLMPGLSGEQTLKALREQKPNQPVVLISGYSADALASEDDHLARVEKPMTMAQLRQAARRVLGRTTPELAMQC